MPKVNFELYSQFRENFPLICSDGVVLNKGKVLLVKRNIKPFTLKDFGPSLVGILILEKLHKSH